jgi:uncharacterized protein (DUF2132 family)
MNLNGNIKDKMTNKDPLHGITLKQIVEALENYFGFDTLAELIPINCFKSNPSVKSSLTFLRKTDWARKKVEDLYVKYKDKINTSER